MPRGDNGVQSGTGGDNPGRRGVNGTFRYRSKRRRYAPIRAGMAAPSRALCEQADLSFDSIYRDLFEDVAHWVRALGAHDADVEDLAQEVFIIVRRKLPGFDGQNLGGFLYRIIQRTVRDHRRSVWCRHLRGRPEPLSALDSMSPTGVDAVQRHEGRRLLDAILARMSEKRRAAFILYEIEGYSGEEIARIHGIPLKTVWTRLHHARKAFVRLVSDLPAEGGE
jgi:RNA polymerase sigma-70 factor, ECF subfamily